MKPTNKHLHNARDIILEETRLARYEWEEASENCKEAQRREAEARDKYQALVATSQLIDHSLGDGPFGCVAGVSGFGGEARDESAKHP